MSQAVSKFLDFYLVIDSPKLDDLAMNVAHEIASGENRRKRGLKEQQKFVSCVKLFLQNFVRIEHFRQSCSQDIVLAVPKTATYYKRNENRFPEFVTYAALIRGAYAGLTNQGYIEVAKLGFWDKEKQKGEVTRISATAKLRAVLSNTLDTSDIEFRIRRHTEEKLVLLKDEKKKLISYTKNKFTREAEKNLAEINLCLRRHWYDLNLAPDQTKALQEIMVRKCERQTEKSKAARYAGYDEEMEQAPYVDFSARQLHRVFNNGSFEEGGRFYGGWWQNIPKEFRSYIVIDGKATTELDFSSLHAHMIYALEGLPLPAKIYDFDGVDKKYAKIAFCALLNTKSGVKKPDDYASETMTWKQLLKATEERHSQIEKWLRSGKGLFLQFKDSQILERVMLHFARMGYPCLPLHDSIIIHHNLQDELREVMLREYCREMETETEIQISTDNNLDIVFSRHRTNTHSSDIFDLEACIREMPEAEKRTLSWFAYRDKKQGTDKSDVRRARTKSRKL